MNTEWDWSVDPIFGSYALPGIFGLLGILALWMLREDRPLLPRQRLILLALRATALLVILLAFLRPGLVFTSQSEPKGALAVMIDTSESMNLAADATSGSRWDVERKLWQRIRANQDRLGKETLVVPYLYDSELRALKSDANSLNTDATAVSLPIDATGATTDVGVALGQLLSTQVEPPLSALIWMGDGTQTVTPSTVEPQQVVKQFTQLDIPIFFLGIGPRNETGKLRDIAIEGLPEQLTVFSSNQTVLTGLLQARGVIHRELPVQLWLRDATGNEQMIGQETWVPEQNEQTIPLRFTLIAPTAGAYELHLRTPVVDGELIEENNQAICFLNVRKGGARVLYLEGEPRYEQLALRRSLESSRDFQVDFQLVYPPEWPKDLTPQLKGGEFDAFIIGDLDSDALNSASWKMILDQVKSGTGLILLGGFHSYGPGGYANNPLAPVIPFAMDGRMRQARNAPRLASMHFDDPIQLQPSGAEHPTTTLGANNLQTWESLRPMQGANRWGKVKNAAGIRVLLESPKGDPMMVVNEAEKGKVLCLAFDTTWQWKLQGKGDIHKQFWRQVVLFGLRGEPAEESLTIEMDKRRLYRAQSAEIQVLWTPGATSTPIPPATKVRLIKDGQDLGNISLERSGDRTLVGRLAAPKEAGQYRLEASTLGSDGKRIVGLMPFLVLDQSIETIQPMPDWALLGQLAAMNEAAGGGLFSPDELDQVFQALSRKQRKAAIEVVQAVRMGDGAIDSWALFLVLCCLWGAQWTLRKKWSLA